MDEVAKAPTNVFSGLDAVADVCLEKNIYRYILICARDRSSKWIIVLDQKFTGIPTTPQ